MTKQEFYGLFVILCETYNREATKSLCLSYYMILEHLKFEDFKSAVVAILSSRKYSSLPMPADILEAINGSSDDKAMLALHELEHAMSRVGAYNSVCFQDSIVMETVLRMGGWIKLCRMTEDEWKFLKKEFMNIYKALSKISFEAPAYLVGIEQKEAEANGYFEDAQKANIYLVGFKEVQNKYILARQYEDLENALQTKQIKAPTNKVLELALKIGQKI